MKRLLFILSFAFLLSSCGIYIPYSASTVPQPGFCCPDDISHFDEVGAHSVTYTYYCHEGEYIVVTYTYNGYSDSSLGPWDESTYRSTGICKK